MEATAIDLQPFCATKETRYSVTSPWVFRGWRYATNGRLAVRTPTTDSDTPAESGQVFPPAHERFAEAFAGANVALPWSTTPYHMALDTCPDCDGQGVTGLVDCQQCEGSGEVECGCCGNDMTCRSCDGKGKRGSGIKCPACGGKKKREVPAHRDFGTFKVKAEYDAMICGLPGLVRGEVKPGEVLPFMFDGGEGLVMTFG